MDAEAGMSRREIMFPPTSAKTYQRSVRDAP
jgi:hypothetical protein